jgi:hypothetical protein
MVALGGKKKANYVSFNLPVNICHIHLMSLNSFAKWISNG